MMKFFLESQDHCITKCVKCLYLYLVKLGWIGIYDESVLLYLKCGYYTELQWYSMTIMDSINGTITNSENIECKRYLSKNENTFFPSNNYNALSDLIYGCNGCCFGSNNGLFAAVITMLFKFLSV